MSPLVMLCCVCLLVEYISAFLIVLNIDWFFDWFPWITVALFHVEGISLERSGRSYSVLLSEWR